ncbi:MAG: 4'-phosphopantetheinyl transferase superfamily protein [Candidatus Omnitrophica bacterium]|nr:4'-phosphopantetheinyl transferase superfamily protein [Candidatus Omnitrophota bacterium]
MRKSIGVDLVEIQKAKRFYSRHHRHLKKFFCPPEMDFIQKGQRPYERLAVLLAAKEAVFKTLSLPWMGLGGFQDIRVVPGRRRGRLKGFLRSKTFEVTYAVNKTYAVARCVGI